MACAGKGRFARAGSSLDDPTPLSVTLLFDVDGYGFRGDAVADYLQIA
jgi:hypothetical protein